MPSREAFTQGERRAIIKCFEQSWESPEIAPQFDASESAVRRVYQHQREQGRDKPAFENCGRRRGCDDEQKRQIIAMVERRCDTFRMSRRSGAGATEAADFASHAWPLAQAVGDHANKR